MACFLVPMAEAIIVTAAKNMIEKKEQKTQTKESKSIKTESSSHMGLDLTRKLSWLSYMLWGGVLLLALEHFWHGEIILVAPFLTAMRNPNDIVPMLHEVVSVGSSMAVIVTLVWGVMVFIAEHRIKRFTA